MKRAEITVDGLALIATAVLLLWVCIFEEAAVRQESRRLLAQSRLRLIELRYDQNHPKPLPHPAGTTA